MKTFRIKEVRFFRWWVLFGFNLSHFGIGFGIDRSSFTLDLGPFWMNIEF